MYEDVPFPKNMGWPSRLWDGYLVFGRGLGVQELEIFARELVVGIES